MSLLSWLLVILAGLSLAAMVVSITIANRSAREARSTIFPVVREEETVRARRARITTSVMGVIAAIMAGAFFLSGQLPSLSVPTLPSPAEFVAIVESPVTEVVSPEVEMIAPAVPTETPLPPTEEPIEAQKTPASSQVILSTPQSLSEETPTPLATPTPVPPAPTPTPPVLATRAPTLSSSTAAGAGSTLPFPTPGCKMASRGPRSGTSKMMNTAGVRRTGSGATTTALLSSPSWLGPEIIGWNCT
jgi:hypothetical protein